MDLIEWVEESYEEDGEGTYKEIMSVTPSEYQPAADPWETGVPPKDGSTVLARYPSGICLIHWWAWKDEPPSWWMKGTILQRADIPDGWARINFPKQEGQ